MGSPISDMLSEEVNRIASPKRNHVTPQLLTDPPSQLGVTEWPEVCACSLVQQRLGRENVVDFAIERICQDAMRYA